MLMSKKNIVIYLIFCFLIGFLGPINEYVWNFIGWIMTALFAGIFAGWFAKYFSDIKDEEKEKTILIQELQCELYNISKSLPSLEFFLTNSQEKVNKKKDIPNIDTSAVLSKYMHTISPVVLGKIGEQIKHNENILKDTITFDDCYENQLLLNAYKENKNEDLLNMKNRILRSDDSVKAIKYAHQLSMKNAEVIISILKILKTQPCISIDFINKRKEIVNIIIQDPDYRQKIKGTNAYKEFQKEKNKPYEINKSQS